MDPRRTISGCLLAAGVGGLLIAGPAPDALAEDVSSAAPLRVFVHVGSELDRKVAARLEGHVSDLNVRLYVTSAAPDTPSSLDPEGGQVTVAHTGSATIWFAERPDRYLVFARPADAAPVLLLRVHHTGTARLSSGELETAALVIRTALRALLMGEPVPSETPEQDEHPMGTATRPPSSEDLAVARDETAAASSEPSSQPWKPQAVTPATELAPESHEGEATLAPESDPVSVDAYSPDGAGWNPTVHLDLFAGPQMVIDGTGDAGRVGGRADIELQVGKLAIGATAAASLATEVEAPFGTLELARHDLLATLALRFGDAEMPLWLGVGAGVALFDRDTGQGSPRLTSRPSRLTPAFMFGPQFGGALMDGAFGLAIRAALDVMPNGPRFIYAGEGAPSEPAYAPPVLTPRVSVGLHTRLL